MSSLNWHFPKEDNQNGQQAHSKMIIREMQTKTWDTTSHSLGQL